MPICVFTEFFKLVPVNKTKNVISSAIKLNLSQPPQISSGNTEKLVINFTWLKSPWPTFSMQIFAIPRYIHVPGLVSTHKSGEDMLRTM